jgi:GNAT superfamily N-acetyltransferase
VGKNLFGLESHVRPLGSRFLRAGVVPSGDQYLSTIEVESESEIVYRRELRFASAQQALDDLHIQLRVMNDVPLEDLQRCAGIGEEGKLSPFGESLQGEVPGSEVELRVKPLNQERRIVDLENLFVPKERRNQGVGTDFMDRVTRWADENNAWLTLSLADKNKERGTTSRGRLIAFYKQFGFVENRGRNKDYSLSLYTSMYRPPKKVNASDEIGEFDTHEPTSIGDVKPKLHYFSRKEDAQA